LNLITITATVWVFTRFRDFRFRQMQSILLCNGLHRSASLARQDDCQLVNQSFGAAPVLKMQNSPRTSMCISCLWSSQKRLETSQTTDTHAGVWGILWLVEQIGHVAPYLWHNDQSVLTGPFRQRADLDKQSMRRSSFWMGAICFMKVWRDRGPTLRNIDKSLGSTWAKTFLWHGGFETIEVTMLLGSDSSDSVSDPSWSWIQNGVYQGSPLLQANNLQASNVSLTLSSGTNIWNPHGAWNAWQASSCQLPMTDNHNNHNNKQ